MIFNETAEGATSLLDALITTLDKTGLKFNASKTVILPTEAQPPGHITTPATACEQKRDSSSQSLSGSPGQGNHQHPLQRNLDSIHRQDDSRMEVIAIGIPPSGEAKFHLGVFFDFIQPARPTRRPIHICSRTHVNLRSEHTQNFFVPDGAKSWAPPWRQGAGGAWKQPHSPAPLPTQQPERFRTTSAKLSNLLDIALPGHCPLVPSSTTKCLREKGAAEKKTPHGVQGLTLQL